MLHVLACRAASPAMVLGGFVDDVPLFSLVDEEPKCVIEAAVLIELAVRRVETEDGMDFSSRYESFSSVHWCIFGLSFWNREV